MNRSFLSTPNATSLRHSATALLKNLAPKAFTLSLLVFAQSALAIADIPAKGMTKEQVKAQFGEPAEMKAAVGKPPISRWDYEAYSVYFEDKYVIHSFLHKQRIRPQLNPAPATEEESPDESASGMQEAEAMTDTEQTQATEASAGIEEAAVTEMESAEESVQQDMEKVEKEMAQEAESSAEMAEAAEAEMQEEADLNYEEKPENTDFGKWGY